jgi:cytochrome c-type biogenesis protein CcmH
MIPVRFCTAAGVHARLATCAAWLTLTALLALPATTVDAQVRVARVDIESVVGPPAGARLAGDALSVRTKAVASLLRCPVCQGLSVWDSPAAMAVNMKNEVQALLAEGYTDRQVLDYFEHSYGEFVRLVPRATGIGVFVWSLPVVMLVGGVLIVSRMLVRRPSVVPAGADITTDPALATYLTAVRELAYGQVDLVQSSAPPPAARQR